jgi:hypothetical protein
VHVHAVDHRIGVAKALAEGLAGGDLADLVFVERVVHHHVVGEDGAAARLVAHAQRVEGVEGVRAELDAGADLADLGRLLQHLDLEALAHQRQRGGQAADAAAGHQHQLLLQIVQHLVAGQHLGHAAVGLAAFADGGEELAVLQLDAVHRHIHLAHVDLFVLAVEQVVVAGDVGAVSPM